MSNRLKLYTVLSVLFHRLLEYFLLVAVRLYFIHILAEFEGKRWPCLYNLEHE